MEIMYITGSIINEMLLHKDKINSGGLIQKLICWSEQVFPCVQRRQNDVLEVDSAENVHHCESDQVGVVLQINIQMCLPMCNSAEVMY